MTSGLLFIVIGLIENPDFRYKIYDTFQIGTSRLFDLVDWKFSSDKDNTIWISNNQIAPIVNLISSFLWTGLILIIIGFFSKQPKLTDFNKNGFWKRVVLTNLIISGFLFLFWLTFMDIDFIYNGVYSVSNSIFSKVYGWIFMLINLPSLIPGLIGSITLDNGGDTAHGYEDMYLATKTMTSFAVTIWSIIGVLIYDKIINLKIKKTKNASS
ncbi:MAG: hypothetical protein COW63_02700 [Bacteroidetes bacterium CG18_big_fil_WC_8_21_14_2_50_41_14]|nr:MAG: hypothetical protein COW63_02700 [Bacteroidetes bacterium CG18_big_fil_WC_8_21_14_2_50_41_14]